MHRTESEEVVRVLMRRRWALLIVNAFLFFAGLATFGITLWVRFDLDFKRWVRQINWYSYWYCTYVVMIAMIVVVVSSAMMLYALFIESRAWIKSSLCMVIVAFVLELIGATVVTIYGVEDSDVLTHELSEVFFRLIYRMDYDPVASGVLKQIQEYVGCCGARGSEDYWEARKPVPLECRHIVTGNEFLYGCKQQLAWWLEPWTATMAGACVIIMIAHIFQFCCAVKTHKQVTIYKEMHPYPHEDDY